MRPGRTRSRLATALMPLLALSAACAAGAAVIDAEVVFPSPYPPALKALVCDVETSRVKTVSIARDSARFSIEVPAGRYIVFLAPDEPGAPDVYGAYTEYSLCTARAAAAAREGAEPCEDHALVTVDLTGRNARASIRIDDWYLSDEVALRLEHLLGGGPAAGAEPQGAPRFSEYRVMPPALPAPKLDFSGTVFSSDERNRILQAVAAGPNFAAETTLALLPCGADCERVVLVDWRTGKVSTPQALADVRAGLPCRAREAVQFRRDSLLLELTRPRPGGVVTQYYLWKPDSGSLSMATEYLRDTAQFCAPLPP